MCNENVIIVERKSKGDTSRIVKEYSAMASATPNLERQNYLLPSNTPIRVSSKRDNRDGYILRDTAKLTLNAFLISKQDDMRGKETPKVRIHLRNGKNFVKNITGDVLIARSERNLLKTTLNLFRQVERIISQTFNHYAVPVIVVSGSSITKIPNY